jgi:hypothetical protein
MAKEYNKNFWLKEIAFNFGMTVGQFSDAISYSRTTIYSAACGSAKLNQGHVRVAINKLNDISDKILENDIQSAKDRHEFRRKLIDDFAKRFAVED